MTVIYLGFHQVTLSMTSTQSWIGQSGQVAPAVFKALLKCVITMEPVENYKEVLCALLLELQVKKKIVREEELTA